MIFPDSVPQMQTSWKDEHSAKMDTGRGFSSADVYTVRLWKFPDLRKGVVYTEGRGVPGTVHERKNGGSQITDIKIPFSQATEISS